MNRFDRPRLALVLAILTAALGWFALGREAGVSVATSLAHGRSWPEALFLFLRFFTILTNLGVALLMSETAWRALHRRPPPVAGFYAAALVYVAVTSITYEALLRHLWSPHGLQFLTDMVMHDVVPALTLAFWIGCAPKASLRWRDPLKWLAYPAAYFALTVLGGWLGEGYPYGFLDAGRLGYPGLLRNACVFMVVFYALGLLVTAAAGAFGGRPRVDPLRTAG